MAEQLANDHNKISFKDTLNLPRTDFPIRAQTKIDDPAMLERWEKEKLADKIFMCHEGKEKFILHDGPPYANGHIHLGHAYNKILKDIVTKSQRMMGKHVPTIPGWDCHGLPIELKVTQENPELKGSALKKACREYAQKWIDVQRQEFKTLGVMMHWDHPYITMDYSYEASILYAFAQFVGDGYIERKNKTVPWCASCQTVLAHAEIEYQDQKDPSIYVTFALEQSITAQLFPNCANQVVNLLIWTTTPWTLPLNRAVLLKPHASYVVLQINNSTIMVAAALADKLCALMNVPKTIIAECLAEQLVAGGARVHHPFIDMLVPLILSDTVSLDDGTALVHCAPGCGPDDYEVGVRNALEIFSPIGPQGTYTSEIRPQELTNMSIKDGQIWVIKKLAELGKLFYKTSIKHSYPHCWRCRNPLIFRATKQWFCDLEKHALKDKALQAADTINALPDKSINRLKATLEGRLEWVLSRQRTWGVPIPALICGKCDTTYSTPELIKTVADEVARKGVEYWDDATVEQLVGPYFSCPVCKATDFKKENDILDVWFESGISHYAVLLQKKFQSFPADMYLEGKDQHRAWFQSSLLTATVLEQQAPMKNLVTHGFTVDAQGRKMSKSLGNVTSPQQMIDALGTDGLRLWAASLDLAGEAIISQLLQDNIKEVFRKIRNTARFMLSNLYDFDISKDAVALDELALIDQYALQELFERNQSIIKAYEQYDFTAVSHALGDYCSGALSSFYLDIIKDRLYVEKANGPLRRSAQTTCWYILDTLTRLIAPIMSFTSEHISDYYQKNKTESIHLQEFNHLADVWQLLARHNSELYPGYDMLKADQFDIRALAILQEIKYATHYHDRWELLKKMRSAVLKAIEGLREKGIIKHSLESHVTLYFDTTDVQYAIYESLVRDLQKSNQSPVAFFKEFFIVSQVMFVSTASGLEESEYPGLWLKIITAQGTKCPRCWNWQETTNEHGLCKRCEEIIG